MFDASKKIAYHDRLMRTGDWNRPKPDKSNGISFQVEYPGHRWVS